MPLPTINTIATDYPAPLEGQDVPEGTALKANFMGTLAGNLGTSLMAHGYSGGQTVPYDDAVKTFRAEGLDPGVLPKDGTISQGYLDAVKNQQIEIQKDRDLVGRSHIGTVGQFASSIAGGALDPVFIGIGAVTGGVGFAAKGASLGGRLAIGGTEGAVTMGAYDAAKKTAGTAQGDPDITSANILHDMAWGGAAGAVLHGALGPRPDAVKVLDVHKQFMQDNFPGVAITSTVRTQAHNAAIGGALHSMHLSGEAMDFVLPKGVTAEQARASIEAKGLPVTEWLIEKKGDLHSTGDHIHWGWGEKGRQQFGQRPMPAETRQAVATAAVAQAGEDSPINVKPLVDAESFRTNPFKIADEHAQEVSRLETEGMQAAVPKPGSIIGADPDTAATLSRMDSQPPAPPAVNPEVNPELADLQKMTTDAVGDAEHAHGLAHPEAVEGEESPLQTALAADDEAIKGDGDLAKAVDAAVRCATVKGIE